MYRKNIVYKGFSIIAVSGNPWGPRNVSPSDKGAVLYVQIIIIKSMLAEVKYSLPPLIFLKR